MQVPRTRGVLDPHSLAAIVAVGGYVVSFPVLRMLMGDVAGALIVVPVAAVAIAYGQAAGVIAGAIAIVLNLLLFSLQATAGLDVGAVVIGGVITVGVGAMLGRYRDVVVRLRDLEHRHVRAEARLQEREADLQHLVDVLPVVVYRIDADRRFALLRGGGLGPLGLAPDELVGSDLMEFLGPVGDDHPAVASVDAALRGSSTEFEMALDGRAYAVRVEPVKGADDAVTGALGMAIDVTAQREHQDELERLLAQQKEANERLESVNAMKDGFLQAVSHELRTPLTSVRGFASTLARYRAAMSPDAADLLFHRLIANADKLDRLLNDLLDVDRLERGMLEPRRTPIELGRTVCELADTIDTGTRRLTLDVEDLTAWLDGPKVERIVENLLGNAVKHTPEGTALTLVVTRTLDGVRIEIRQRGVPVPDELKQVIFEPFRQGPLRTEHQPGTGIGLSLVSRFAALHGGRAWVQDTLDGGAAFCVELPADMVEAHSAPARREAVTR